MSPPADESSVLIDGPWQHRFVSATGSRFPVAEAGTGPVLKWQIPRYEHVLTRDDAWLIGDYLRRWGGQPWVTSPEFIDYEWRCRTAMRIPQVAFCALEAYRWAFRSALRLHGYRFVK